MGVCPQHDVLFEQMTVEEHVLFFSQLKGFTKEQAAGEVEGLTKQFHLHERLDHTGEELSGGQKRKLSVAIAICGGSKFIVLGGYCRCSCVLCVLIFVVSVSMFLLMYTLYRRTYCWIRPACPQRTVGSYVCLETWSYNSFDYTLYG